LEKRIVLIGAGSAQFGYGTMGDVFQSKVLEGSHVVLHDINPDTLAVVAKTGQQFIEENNLPFSISATTSRAEALQGADFCVISIEIGDRFELWEQDWRVGQQYGIRQVYGENGGPGGLFHSLRIIPPILEICGDVMEICPDATVMNFSNPMSRICTTVHRKYPDLKLIGLCHEINSLKEHLPRILGVPYDQLETVAGGLNHFSILLKAVYRETGQDAYPDIRQKAPAYFERMVTRNAEEKHFKETGRRPKSVEDLDQDGIKYEEWSERRLFKVILEDFGYLPITTDSHFGEYIQWAHDAVEHKGILDFYNWYKRWLPTEETKIELKLRENVVPIIEGIKTDSGYREEAVNLPNVGLIDDLPEWLAVEVPATVDARGVHGVALGQLPPGFLGLLQNQVAVHNMTAEAVLTGSKEAVLQALLVDPIVGQYHSTVDLLDTMLELQSDYLGYIK
jgi:alpha-galactosidase